MQSWEDCDALQKIKKLFCLTRNDSFDMSAVSEEHTSCCCRISRCARESAWTKAVTSRQKSPSLAKAAAFSPKYATSSLKLSLAARSVPFTSSSRARSSCARVEANQTLNARPDQEHACNNGSTKDIWCRTHLLQELLLSL